MSPLNRILNLRLWSLFVKEFHQIRRNRRLVILLIIPPTLNIILFGLALNPTFENLRLGVVDESRTPESRELVSAFTEGLVFKTKAYYSSTEELGQAISRAELDAGLVVPRNFAEKRARHETSEVQLLLDAVNANSATIAGGYAARIIASLNQKIALSQPRGGQPTESTALQPSPPTGDTSNAPSISLSPNNPSVSLTTNVPRAMVTPRLTILYNPGLKSAWFITTGMIGLLLVLQGSVVDIGLALGVARLVFGVPVRGSLLLFFVAASLCVLCGIGLGMMIATFTRTQQQAQLMGFFTNPPLALLSGATTPIEAMPTWQQPITSVNPVKHFAIISRGILLKGSGVDVLYPQLLALAVIALVMVSVSAWQFRKQLG